MLIQKIRDWWSGADKVACFVCESDNIMWWKVLPLGLPAPGEMTPLPQANGAWVPGVVQKVDRKLRQVQVRRLSCMDFAAYDPWYASTPGKN